MKRFLPYVILIISSAIPAKAFTPSSEGIYAIFEVSYFEATQLEVIDVEFTIQLFYTHAPVTCANFVGLATGEIPWLNLQTGEIVTDTKFFDGLTFHRIVPNFIIQTGSRNTFGTDGPGWRIPDEVHPELNHVSGGVVSMANSSLSQARGTNSGGSQFFITMAPFPENQASLDALNGRHSIFAIVVEGTEHTQAINRTPLIGNGQQPVIPPVINSVTIIREGAAALAWDASQYWPSPVFTERPVVVTNELEDIDNNPDTPDIRVLRANWIRDKDDQYIFQDSNNLSNWITSFFDRTGFEDTIENRAVDVEIGLDGRHFYRLIEAGLEPIEDMEGDQIIINIDPVEVDEGLISYLPEEITINFYDELQGGFTLQRSDSPTMDLIGPVTSYKNYPLGDRTQLDMQLNFFSDMQAYLDYDTPTSGTAYIFYPDGRTEGNTATGTFTVGQNNGPMESENKDGTRLVMTITTTQNEEEITTTYTIDLWDNFAEVELSELFEGGYEIAVSYSEFIQTGRVLYDWVKIGDQTYVLLDFDIVQDMQILLSDGDAISGSLEAFFPITDSFESGTFTQGPGEPRPDSTSQTGNKLVLDLELTGSRFDPLQDLIDIDFYTKNTGGFRAERTDSEANQFGDIVNYEWFEDLDSPRVDLEYNELAPMQAYLTFTTRNEAGSGNGTTQVHFPGLGLVLSGTFTFTVGGGEDPPVAEDKTGTRLELEFGLEAFDLLTVDLYDAATGIYEIQRTDSPARPTGVVLEYNWSTKSNGNGLVFITYERVPRMQIELNPSTPGADVGEAVVLSFDSGETNTVPYTISQAPERPQPVNKVGTNLFVDLELSDTNSLIDFYEINFNTPTTGDFIRTRPNDTIYAGNVDFYEWLEKDGFDQVNIRAIGLLDNQMFLNYNTATSGTVAVFFITGQNIETGTFEIRSISP